MELFICPTGTMSLSVLQYITYCFCSLHRSQLSHPISPYPLDLDWRMYFSPELLCKSLLVGLIWVFSPASQASMPSWTFTILENVIIIIFVLRVIYSYRATLRGSGQGSILGGGWGGDGGE